MENRSGIPITLNAFHDADDDDDDVSSAGSEDVASHDDRNLLFRSPFVAEATAKLCFRKTDRNLVPFAMTRRTGRRNMVITC